MGLLNKKSASKAARTIHNKQRAKGDFDVFWKG